MTRGCGNILRVLEEERGPGVGRIPMLPLGFVGAAQCGVLAGGRRRSRLSSLSWGGGRRGAAGAPGAPPLRVRYSCPAPEGWAVQAMGYCWLCHSTQLSLGKSCTEGRGVPDLNFISNSKHVL